MTYALRDARSTTPNGFTLLEIGVVIAVLVTLIGGFTAYRVGAIDQAERERLTSDLSTLLDVARAHWERNTLATPGTCVERNTPCAPAAFAMRNGAVPLNPPPAPPFVLNLSVAPQRAELGELLPASASGRNPWGHAYRLVFYYRSFGVRTCLPDDLAPAPLARTGFGAQAPLMRFGCGGCPGATQCVEATRSYEAGTYMNLLARRRRLGG